MKTKSKLLLITILISSGLLLAACGAAPASSWSGVAGGAGMAYLSGGQVFALNLDNGSIVWQFPEKADADKSFHAPVGLGADDQLIVGDYANTLYSFNAKTGQQNWMFPDAKGSFIGAALVTDDAIYAPNNDYNLYAFDLKGTLLWTFQAKNAIWAKPLMENGVLYVASLDQNLYALDAKTGKQVWKQNVGGAMPDSPTLSSEGVLYVGTLAKEVYAIDAATGKIIWHVALDNSMWSAPAIKDDSLYIGDLGGIFYDLNKANGTIRWKSIQEGQIVGTPLILDEMTVFGTEMGKLVAIDFNGKQLWSKPFEGKLYGSPVLVDDTILIASLEGSKQLYALDVNGNEKWSFTLPK